METDLKVQVVIIKKIEPIFFKHHKCNRFDVLHFVSKSFKT